LETEFDDDAWTSPSRTPPYHPDAVTLAPDVVVADLLTRVDSSSGCSVKDSFACLDLATYGFHVLFDARWLVRVPASQTALPPADTWSIVTAVDAFAMWEEAWQRHNEQGDVLRAGLLDVPVVTVLAERKGDHVVAGAILNRAAGVVGISNFFADPLDAAASWDSCIEFTSALFPGSALVTYESDREVIAARRLTFEDAGPLRVWIRP
jgi:hypothetical protein